MGTHSLIIFQQQGVRFLVIYQQFDGYLTGVGAELAEFLNNCVIVNGISSEDEERCLSENKILCNGFGCLIARFVATCKKEAGNFYVLPCSTTDEENYNYIVECDKNEILTVSVNKSKFMTVQEFLKYCYQGSDDIA